ncbi:hypothetical protein C1645_811615 [Glomus cerebriforme]|uniref:Uncharacterized protein n=1 Tax=Glomus cerebriforme TaxID=658196 RepID=A0A397TPK1_9GLOM|nr:hypothetical protein C1645_811615 [Glomus cerebriforme]
MSEFKTSEFEIIKSQSSRQNLKYQKFASEFEMSEFEIIESEYTSKFEMSEF